MESLTLGPQRNRTCSVCGKPSGTQYYCQACISSQLQGAMDKLPVENINKPKHYDFSIQPIDAIEAWGLGFALGCAVKYIARAGKKSVGTEIEDCRKAIWYLERRIKEIGK